MKAKIVDIGRIIAFIGVIPMVAVSFYIGVSLMQIIPEHWGASVQTLMIAAGPGVAIWVLIAEGDRPEWGGSGLKDGFKALLIILIAIVTITLIPSVAYYDSLQQSITQIGAMICILGAIVIIIGALA